MGSWQEIPMPLRQKKICVSKSSKKKIHAKIWPVAIQHTPGKEEKKVCVVAKWPPLHFILVVMPYFMFCVATAVALRPLYLFYKRRQGHPLLQPVLFRTYLCYIISVLLTIRGCHWYALEKRRLLSHIVYVDFFGNDLNIFQTLAVAFMSFQRQNWPQTKMWATCDAIFCHSFSYSFTRYDWFCFKKLLTGCWRISTRVPSGLTLETINYFDITQCQ